MFLFISCVYSECLESRAGVISQIYSTLILGKRCFQDFGPVFFDRPSTTKVDGVKTGQETGPILFDTNLAA